MTAQVTSKYRDERITTLRVVGNVSLFGLMLILAILFVAPFFWTAASSLKSYGEIYRYPPTLFPAKPMWENYRLIFTQVPFLRFIYNTLMISVLTVIGATGSSALVGYSFSRFRWPGRDVFFIICLATMMLPVEVTLIPTYILFSKIKWIDTWRPLIVPAWFGGGAFNIFLFRQFFMTIPMDLDDAAMIDGAGPFRTFWEILLPLCKPAITTVMVIGFIGSWNNFLGPLVFLNTTEKYPISLGIQWFQGVAGNIGAFGQPTEQLMMAAAFVATLLPLIIFMSAQRFFVEGIVTTGFKGAA
ncbi:MAG: carbohydrate ABC transporter permease [Chloroflexi bacterium]|nr:carbohydrate ABC transporter permease [Chloroflexota bacterium]